MKLNKIIPISIVVLGAVVVYFRPMCAITSKITEVQNATSIPHFTAPMLLNESNFDIANIKEPTVLLHFWASWCSVCMAEMNDLIEETTQQNGQVALVTISIDSNKTAALEAFGKFKNPKQANIYWLWDKDRNISLNTFNITKTPETIVVNEQRKMIRKIVGPLNITEAIKN